MRWKASLRFGGEQPWYRVEDRQGHVLAGNLPVWPDARPEVSAAGIMRLGDGTRVQYRVTLVARGLRLLVGRSTTTTDRSLAWIGALFAAALVAMAAIAFAIGRFAARALNRRLSAINAVFARVGVEGPQARAPVSAAGDEIDTLSENLNQVLCRVDHLLIARKELSDTIAHETRSPLMLIGARITKAREAGLDPAADQELESAQGQITSLRRMLDALLDIASSEAQRGEMNSLAETDLGELAGRLVQLYEPSAEAIGLRLEARIAAPVMMRGDAVQLSSLIGNLLDNAFKYGTAGGVIRLIVEPGPRIVVEDEGEGIDPAIAETLFDRFSRAHAGDGGRRAGHGLGLALVRAIAERHDLQVHCEPTLATGDRRGARFVIA
jgi:signal transduction histidine kinase